MVLEGGYSIEGSLPYVNVGIILALAGLDYTRCSNPNYPGVEAGKAGPGKVVHNVAFLQKLGQVGRRPIWAGLWRNEFFRRKRRLYYDTDDIHEMQLEEIKDVGNAVVTGRSYPLPNVTGGNRCRSPRSYCHGMLVQPAVTKPKSLCHTGVQHRVGLRLPQNPEIRSGVGYRK